MKRKQLSRRDFLRLSGLATAGTVLAACVPAQAPAPAGSESAADAPGDVPEAEPVELSLTMVDFADQTQVVLEDELIPDYQLLHPSVTVAINYTAWERYNEEMTTAFAGGITPDVFQGGAVWAPQMARRGWSLPLDDYISSASEGWDWDDFFPALQDDATINGEVVCVPYRIDIRSFWYRSDHLSEAGIENPPTNWEELREAAIALTQREGDDITREGFHYSGPAGGWQGDLQPYMYFMEMAGGQFLSDDLSRCTLADPPAVEALEYVRRLIVEDQVQPYPGFDNQGNLGPFEVGLASMTMGSATIENTAATYAPDQLEYLMVTEPLEHTVKATHVWVNKFFISSESKTPGQAWDFLQYLTNQESLTKYCASGSYTPPRRSLGEADFMTDRMKILLAATEYAVPYPKHWRLIELFRPLANSLEECLSGQVSAQEAMDEACAAIDEILAEDA